MNGETVRLIYLALLALETAFLLLLDLLNLRRLAQYGTTTPPHISDLLTAEEYRRSILYSRDRTRFSLVASAARALFTAILVATGLAGLVGGATAALPLPGPVRGAAAVLLMGIVFTLLDLPFSIFSTFVIEERHGFNRMNAGLFLLDLAKSALLGLILFLPLLSFLIWTVAALGSVWWLWGFGAVALFQLLIAFLFPILIAPLFYRFTPLEEGALRTRIESLAAESGFTLSSIQIMDGSRRSGKANAFFTGFGKSRRIALFDTLIDSLNEEEIAAVVAHELGHAKLRHTLKQLVGGLAILLLSFAVLALLLNWTPLYGAFGFAGASISALLIIVLYFGSPLTVWLGPLQSILSRRREYEADAYAAEVLGDYRPLAEGLIKLHKKNRSNPVPHPLYSFFHYSHPTVRERIDALRSRANEQHGERT